MQTIRFRSEIDIPRYPFKLEHFHRVATFGSCFAANMGERLEAARFSVLDNPFGVLYNPFSIRTALQRAADNHLFGKDDLIFHEEQWHSFYHHSDFSRGDPQECLRVINESIRKTQSYLSKTDFILITYGTAYVYRYRKNGQIVSNCHKIPAKEFDHFRLSLSQISENIRRTIAAARRLNPEIRFIFSVSPIRYLKEGFTENQLSKALLLLAVHEAIGQDERSVYFPAYEIMMDDLRDYRFYEANLVHPNALAIDYIWHIFAEAFFSEECRRSVQKTEKLVSACRHRPRNPGAGKYKQFLINQLKYADDLQKEFPYLKLDEEISFLQETLTRIENGDFNL